MIDIEGEYIWKMMALNKRTGEVLWSHDAAKGTPRSAHHFKATQANSTPATDGRVVVAMLGSEGLFAWDLDGKLLWKKDLGQLDVGWFYDPSYEWGFSSSPILYDGKVILQADDNRSAFIAAYDVKTGAEIWKTERDNLPSWGTPTLVKGPAGMELVTNGSRDIRAYDPATGEELWHLTPTGEVTVATPIVGPGDLVYVTARYRPIQPIYAVRPGGRGDISIPDPDAAEAGSVESADHIAWWDPRGGVYIPTPVVYGDVLYLVEMRGIVRARDAVTGEELYKERVAERGSAAITASPVAAGGHLYVASEDGDVYVFRPRPHVRAGRGEPAGRGHHGLARRIRERALRADSESLGGSGVEGRKRVGLGTVAAFRQDSCLPADSTVPGNLECVGAAGGSPLAACTQSRAPAGRPYNGMRRNDSVSGSRRAPLHGMRRNDSVSGACRAPLHGMRRNDSVSGACRAPAAPCIGCGVGSDDWAILDCESEISQIQSRRGRKDRIRPT